MLKVFFLSLWIFTQNAHVTFMGVECLPENGEIKVFVKMNYNDFVNDYRYTINDDQGFDRAVKIDTSVILVARYIAHRIQLSADEINLKGRLINFQSDGREINIDCMYKYDKRSKEFKVKNTMLTGVTYNQYTLLIFKHQNLEEGVKLTAEMPEKSFTLK